MTCSLDAPLYLEGTLKKVVTCSLDAQVCNLSVPYCNWRVVTWESLIVFATDHASVVIGTQDKCSQMCT